MTYNNWIYIAVMAAVSYAIRVLPLTLIRRPIKNQFIQSFLYSTPPRTRWPVRWHWWSALQPHGAGPACSKFRWRAAPWSSLSSCFWCTEG